MAQNLPPGHRLAREVLSYENGIYHFSFHHAGTARAAGAAKGRYGGYFTAYTPPNGGERLQLLPAAATGGPDTGGGSSAERKHHF